MTNDIIENKYISLFLLHALGDTIGFKNSDWPIIYNKEASLDTISERIFEFIELGGVNGIDLKDWSISDDTLFHITIAKSILKYKNIINNTFILNVKNNMISMNNKIVNEKEKYGINRFVDIITTKYIQKFTKDKDSRNYDYDPISDGAGAATRNLCIGLAFYKEDNLDTLIDMSITLSKLTHNSPHGFLAGLTSAYFVSLAIREIDIIKWPFMLIELVESDKIKKYINFQNNNEFLDYISYIRYWRKYLDTRFVDYKPIKSRSINNMIFRVKYYYENFVKDTQYGVIGNSGYCTMIVVYDALLDCDGKWEKIIFYSILYPGITDTIGAIAGGLYGAIYEFGDVPQKMLFYLEEKKQLLKLGKQFYKKYYKFDLTNDITL